MHREGKCKIFVSFFFFFRLMIIKSELIILELIGIEEIDFIKLFFR